ncbi:MAG: NAD-dependent deacetylase [Candidatus Azotimanducaceae bacterium]|jgi:NAD-dependent deacetylase
MTEAELDQFRHLIHGANNVVIFTGAGISTESGIPDFRGPNGIWKTMRPIDFKDFVGNEEMRRESWRRRFSGDGMAQAVPNSGHLAVAKLVNVGKVSFVITQNVDGLHQKSGIPDERVIELHGNANYASCLSCHKRYELEDIRASFEGDEIVPYCSECSGIIKTATISFGQSMPERPMTLAQQATLSADLFIAVGSSLTVYPAASFPRVAHQQGAKLVIVNNEPTDLDPICDLVLHHPIGATLTAAVN